MYPFLIAIQTPRMLTRLLVNFWVEICQATLLKTVEVTNGKRVVHTSSWRCLWALNMEQNNKEACKVLMTVGWSHDFFTWRVLHLGNSQTWFAKVSFLTPDYDREHFCPNHGKRLFLTLVQVSHFIENKSEVGDIISKTLKVHHNQIHCLQRSQLEVGAEGPP